MTFYSIIPVPAPRMTQSDRWKKRQCVLNYFAFKDECRLRNLTIPDKVQISFCMPFPVSYDKKKRNSLDGTPHQLKPDLDNLVKALLDAVRPDDQKVWSVQADKIWSHYPGIRINAV